MSESGDVTIGVPQGSILGPLLFVLYTNDMPRAILHSCINMYADDTEIHYANKELSMVEKRLQEDLYALESWMSSNWLKFNVKENHVLCFVGNTSETERQIYLCLPQWITTGAGDAY